MGISLVRVCNELWERALMTTAAQVEGAPGHVVIISNGLFSRKCAGECIKYSLAGVEDQPLSNCAGSRETSGVLACLRHRVFPSRIVGLAWDAGGGWLC